MSNPQRPTEDYHKPGCYEIRLCGQLDQRWADWFGSLKITLDENGHTLLISPPIDQAALYGLLRKTRDVGLPLLSVMRVLPEDANGSEVVESQKEI